MSHVKEDDIFRFLQDKSGKIKAEIKRIQTVLDILTREVAHARVICCEKKKAERGKVRPVTFIVPSEYNEYLGTHLKIAYALKKIGPATGQQIFVYINDLEPEADPIQLRSDILQTISGMENKSLIGAEKRGENTFFSLKHTLYQTR